MKGLLNQIFSRFKPQVFLKFAPFISLLADIILIFYINQSLLPRIFNKQTLLPLLAKLNPQIMFLANHELENMIQLMQSTISLTFTIFLGFNTFMYIMASRKIKWGVKFTYGYTLSTALFSIVELLGSFGGTIPFSWATLITLLLYLYVYMGLKYFKKSWAQ